MSHFTVIVIGNDPETQLIPYQENTDDCPKEFLKFFSVEESYKIKYEKESTKKVIMPDGRMLNTWDDEFRIPGTFGTGSDTHKIPDHLEQKNISYKELFPTFEKYMKEWCGFKERDETVNEYGYWENSNAKWDWYRLGGRWLGYFKLKHPNMERILGQSDADNKPKYDTDRALKKGNYILDYLFSLSR